MRIVCQQTILMKHNALFVIFEKSSNIWNCRLLQIIGGALSVNLVCYSKSSSGTPCIFNICLDLNKALPFPVNLFNYNSDSVKYPNQPISDSRIFMGHRQIV